MAEQVGLALIFMVLVLLVYHFAIVGSLKHQLANLKEVQSQMASRIGSLGSPADIRTAIAEAKNLQTTLANTVRDQVSTKLAELFGLSPVMSLGSKVELTSIYPLIADRLVADISQPGSALHTGLVTALAERLEPTLTSTSLPTSLRDQVHAKIEAFIKDSWELSEDEQETICEQFSDQASEIIKIELVNPESSLAQTFKKELIRLVSADIEDEESGWEPSDEDWETLRAIYSEYLSPVVRAEMEKPESELRSKLEEIVVNLVVNKLEE